MDSNRYLAISVWRVENGRMLLEIKFLEFYRLLLRPAQRVAAVRFELAMVKKISRSEVR